MHDAEPQLKHEALWLRSDNVEYQRRRVSLHYCRTFQEPRAGEMGLVVCDCKVGGCGDSLVRGLMRDESGIETQGRCCERSKSGSL